MGILRGIDAAIKFTFQRFKTQVEHWIVDFGAECWPRERLIDLRK
jgi:hypothetical protein